MSDPRERVGGVTVEGLAAEFLEWSQGAPRSWRVSFWAWADSAALDAEREREVRAELEQIRSARDGLEASGMSRTRRGRVTREREPWSDEKRRPELREWTS